MSHKNVNVSQIAKLTNITLNDQEATELESKFAQTLKTIAVLEELDTQKIKETPQVINTQNIFREDVVDTTRMFSQNQALANSSNTHNGYFVVQKVLHET